MPRTMKLLVCLIALLFTAPIYAQTATPASTSAPVARVYVARPLHIGAFDVSSAGKLTAVPGQPFPGNPVNFLSVTAKFLFGVGDDNQHIYTYAIASTGAIKQVASVNAASYLPQGRPGDRCCGPTRLDLTGSTLYNYIFDEGFSGQEEFKIESNGELHFIGISTAYQMGGLGMSEFLGNNHFAYQTACDGNVPQDNLTQGYKRESSGLLQPINQIMELPEAKPGFVYCPLDLAADPSNHLAIEMVPVDVDMNQGSGPAVLASYTADSQGNLNTKSTMKTMPVINGGAGISISPTGKLLVVGSAGGGFLVYHFNGANPIVKYTRVLNPTENFVQFGWDKDNHLFALSTLNLHVYSATSTSVKEEPGSPYSIIQASSIIVKSLN